MSRQRAWVELDFERLEHNANEIRSILSKKTKIMAVLKANAYGHGSVEIAKECSRIGIDFFAVATINEAIELREAAIKEDILILGYTPLNMLEQIKKYDLIQTIVDFDYANRLNEMKLNIRTHVKLDTGMHRIGIQYYNEVLDVYKMKNIIVEGIYTHLCASDSNIIEDKEFTDKQINMYFKVYTQLKNEGIEPGLTHILSSYGVLNYPEIECDYVRIGNLLFGIKAFDTSTKLNLNLKPILELKTRIMSIRSIEKEETVGYNRLFCAKLNSKIATLSVGYGDGLPYNQKIEDVYVLVNNKLAKIVGKVCMDSCMIDVTGINEIHDGDEVTLICNDSQSEVSIRSIAQKCNMSTNEFLSRFTRRIEFVGE